MPILVATDREVVLMNVDRGASTPAHGIGGRPTCLSADPLVQGRAWCGTNRNGVFRTDDGGRSWQSVGLAGPLIMAVSASPIDRDVVWVGTEPSAVWRSEDAGTTWVLSAETGYSSRSLDCVSSARSGTTVGRDRGRSARVHDRWWPHMERPRTGWTMGHPRTRRSSQGSRYTARRGRGRIFRE